MSSINYRIAKKEDALRIANLHAESWSLHYRGSFTDEYLDGPVYDDRLNVWQERLSNPKPDQFVLLAEEEDQLLGFICMFLNENKEFGSLIDNLHVSSHAQRQGIGRALMENTFQYLREKFSDPQDVYLWVLKDNDSAIRFYESVGGVANDIVMHDHGDAGAAEAVRIIFRGLGS